MAEFKPEGDHIHPLREEAKLETLKWISSYEGVDAKLIAMMKHSRADYMAAFSYPDVDFDDLVLAMEWFYWAFLMDDSVDCGKLSREGIENLAQMYEEVQMNRDIAERQPLPLILEMFQAIWFKMCQKNRPCFEGLFASASINYTRAISELDKMRNDAGIPDVETYKRNRRLVIWFEGALQFTGFILDLKRRGDMCNLVSLIMIHKQKSVQDAIDDVEKELRSQLLKWRSAKMHILQTYQSHHDIEDLKSFIEGCKVWIWIAVAWSFVAGKRYFGDEKASEEAQNTRIVHIMPRELDT
ncbi:isoprenoid synthase domain-containing protein [Mycena capillaripes]|nr:isoprenoid synthase domain-containing protein [Mycena capillaripes]